MSRYSSVILAFVVLLSASVRAQDNPAVPDEVDLQAVLRIVREVSPRLAVERQSIIGAEANRIAASAYPNPTLNYGYSRQGGGQPTVFTGSRQDQTSVDFPLLIAGQRGARIDKAEREIEAARARVAAGASTLAAEAGVAFVALLAAQEKLALQSSATEELVRLRNIVAGRAELGMASRYDLSRLEVELGSFRTKQEDAKGEIADRTGSLAELLGISRWRPKAAGKLGPLSMGGNAFDALPERARTSPATLSAVGEERLAQSAVELARRERWPVPSLNVGRSWTSEPFGASNFLGLSVEIPIFDTRRGPVAKAEAEATAATLRREMATAATAANLQRYAGVIAARQAALQRFDADTAVRLPGLQEMAENAYRLGRGSIFELLDSTRSRYDLYQVRIDLLASIVEAQLRFLAASGELERGIVQVEKP
jgi:cobalt-zinc-cadmium efflux system outer membrane protein